MGWTITCTPKGCNRTSGENMARIFRPARQEVATYDTLGNFVSGVDQEKGPKVWRDNQFIKVVDANDHTKFNTSYDVRTFSDILPGLKEAGATKKAEDAQAQVIKQSEEARKYITRKPVGRRGGTILTSPLAGTGLGSAPSAMNSGQKSVLGA